MNLAIFGATGGTGRPLVEQALAAGHHVTVLVRTPASFAIQHGRLRVVQGDVRQADQVAAVVAGQDAILSALGPHERGPVDLCTAAMTTILAAMERHGVRRLIALSAYGARESHDSGLYNFMLWRMRKEKATVVLVGRDAHTGAAVQREIRQRTGNTAVDLLLADLSSQQEIRRLAEEFRRRYERLHVLVNNAGAHITQRRLSPDGLEMNLAVNHLASFLLTNLLLDMLRVSAPARIVNVASNAMTKTIDLDDLQSARVCADARLRAGQTGDGALRLCPGASVGRHGCHGQCAPSRHYGHEDRRRCRPNARPPISGHHQTRPPDAGAGSTDSAIPGDRARGGGGERDILFSDEGNALGPDVLQCGLTRADVGDQRAPNRPGGRGDRLAGHLYVTVTNERALAWLSTAWMEGCRSVQLMPRKPLPAAYDTQ